jgi:tRNA(Ile)-lysidine synthetase-like protein
MLSLALLAEAEQLVLHVACIDHQLRQSAAQEAQHVVAVAGRLGLAAQVLPIDVPVGPSRQGQARSARYAALLAEAERIGASWIALGHTRDDQTETMLMRWLGGAGPRGLAGIRAVSSPPVTRRTQVRLLRPLLTVARTQVDSFLQRAAPLVAPLPVEDPSNLDPRYLRSRLRHEVLPILRRVAPHLDAHLLDLSEQLARDATFLDDQAALALQGLLASTEAPAALRRDGQLAISIHALSRVPSALSVRIFRRLLGPALGARHVTALLSLCADTAGNKWLDLPGCGRIERCRGWLLLPACAATLAPMHADAETRPLFPCEPALLDGCEAEA